MKKSGYEAHQRRMTRRTFIGAGAACVGGCLGITDEVYGDRNEPIIDLHQHTNYSGRNDRSLIRHQRAMGVTKTILLPAGKYYGLAANCGGNDTVLRLARDNPEAYVFFANEVADLPMAVETIERYLKLGAIGIGEQKFNLDCDSKPIERIAALAGDYGVPVLLHFQHNAYNTSIRQFRTILEKFPKTNFIGHAQTWWGNIDLFHDQTVMYPTGPVTPGGITDRLLSDYPNMFGDMSAGSGLNALVRDEDHTRDFLERHQDKLIFGSDCNDAIGRGPGCQGSRTIATIRRLAPDKRILTKLLSGNAKGLMRL